MRSQTLIKITLKEDVEVRGRIAWYDRETVAVTREDGVNLVLYKQAIRHIEDD